MKESAILFGKDRSLVGILTENGTGSNSGIGNSTGVLFLNAGVIHRIGPNRIYVKIARRLASMGFVALRFDFSGIGDSGFRADKLPVNKSVIDEAQQAMDYLQHSMGLKKFVLVGNCSGAANAGIIAAADPRVTKAVLINPLMPLTPQAKHIATVAYYRKHALFDLNSWLKLLLMQSNYSNIWRAICLFVKRRTRPNFTVDSDDLNFISDMNEGLKLFRNRGMHLLIVYSDDDIIDQYCSSNVEEYNLMKELGFLQTELLRGADHSVTPLCFQAQLLRIISEWLGNND